MNAPAATLPLFQASFAPPDDELAANLLAGASRDSAAESRVDTRATKLVEAIRAKATGLGGVEEFLRAYSLSTKEGLALMVLAEALLRVPDSATADRLIEDKLAAGRWRDGDVKSTAILVSASAWTLGVAARVIHPGETPDTILENLIKRLGLPAVRAATRQAMRLLGSHFVLGQTIEEALGRAGAHRELRYSFDMLGEGARTGADAERLAERDVDRRDGRPRGAVIQFGCGNDRACQWRLRLIPNNTLNRSGSSLRQSSGCQGQESDRQKNSTCC